MTKRVFDLQNLKIYCKRKGLNPRMNTLKYYGNVG